VIHKKPARLFFTICIAATAIAQHAKRPDDLKNLLQEAPPSIGAFVDHSKIPFLNCKLDEACDNGQSRLWGQTLMGLDLMREEISKIEKESPLPEVKIAVVDSGFEKSLQKKFNTKSFAALSFPDASVDALADLNGHGTAVAALIAGSNGLGGATGQRLTSYRLSKADADGHIGGWHGSSGTLDLNPATMLNDLKSAVDKACADGNEIINFSWGNVFEEMGDSLSYEVAHKSWLDSLAARGCLVVNSSGNSNVKKRKKNFLDPDDAMLRVGAIRPIDCGLTNFTTIGEVYAPGQSIATLGAGLIGKNSRACTKSYPEEVRVNGTSFAAPLVAGVAAQAKRILKTSPEFNSMKAPDQIRLLKRVVRASTIRGSVNALRSVMIASAAAKSKSLSATTSSYELLKLHIANSKMECSQTPPLCVLTKTCGARKACFHALRRHEAACPQNEWVRSQLFLVSLASNDLESASIFMGNSDAKDSKEQKILDAQANAAFQLIREQSAAAWDDDRVLSFYSKTKTMSPEVSKHVLAYAQNHLAETLQTAGNPDKALSRLMDFADYGALDAGFFDRLLKIDPTGDLYLKAIRLVVKSQDPPSLDYEWLKPSLKKYFESVNDPYFTSSVLNVLNSCHCIGSYPDLIKIYIDRSNGYDSGTAIGAINVADKKLQPGLVKDLLSKAKLTDNEAEYLRGRIFSGAIRVHDFNDRVEKWLATEAAKPYADTSALYSLLGALTRDAELARELKDPDAFVTAVRSLNKRQVGDNAKLTRFLLSVHTHNIMSRDKRKAYLEALARDLGKSQDYIYFVVREANKNSGEALEKALLREFLEYAKNNSGASTSTQKWIDGELAKIK